ncbi:MAG: RNA polymerase sigma factor [Anaerolineae bacterium]|nr:RNA polymerase sigma factor [Anaerolineae bacterium]
MFLIVLPDVVADEGLLTQLQRGDRQAVVQAYESYFTPLYQYVRLKVGDRALAQDIVSEVFVKLLESAGKPSAPRENLRAWLFTVARNAVYRVYGQSRQLPLADLEEWMPAPAETDPGVLMDSLPPDRIRHALRMLAADHQEVLILRFGQRMSLKETADLMGKSTAAIKSLQFRAVETLRMILLQPEANHG